MRALVAVLAVAVVMGGVSACETVPGQPTSDMTMSELIQRSTNPDGTVGLRESLVEFSYLYGVQLPGVTLPLVRADPPGFRVSGTGALNDVRRHWTELTDDQRAAVAATVPPPPVRPPRFRSAEPSDQDKALAVIRPEINRLIVEYGQRMGGGVKLPAPTYTMEDKEIGEYIRAQTVVDGTGKAPFPGSLLGSLGPVGGCRIRIPPSIWHAVAHDQALAPTTRLALAHELFHCFQGVNSPDLSQYIDSPHWEGDGAGEFVGMLISQSAVPVQWEHYMTTEVPLFQRWDSAMGWWSLMARLGHDPFQLLPPLWKAGVTSSQDYYVGVGGTGDDVYDTWAASRLREPGLGPDWETDGIGVPPRDQVRPVVEDQPATNGVMAAFPLVPRAFRLQTPDGLTGILRVNSGYPIRVHDSGSLDDRHIDKADYCLGTECTCPKDTERAGEEFQPVQGPLYVAVNGGEAAGNWAITDVVSLVDYCKKKQPDRKTLKRFPWPKWAQHGPAHNKHGSGGSGTSSSTMPKPATAGDPHVTRLDGTVYDFQAAGEFTLVRSDSGDLDVQTRQEPWVKFDGTRSDTATMNTAVAAKVAGDRVVFYAGKDKPEARVNDKPVTADQTLRHGGTLFTVDSGYGVRWPDGTELWAVNAGGDSLNVLFGPPANVPLHGLVGPELIDRSGHKVADLYKEFGESWRIRQEDSLFDYAPGQSTATFTHREIPTKRLTLADLSPEQRAAGEKACEGVPKELHDQCVFDVAVSGNNKFAVGYRTLDKLTTTGGGGLRLGQRVGPQKLEAGQQQTFTVNSDADALYFASDADCTKATSATVYWRITMPDGHDTLQVPMCADPGRQTTTKHGTWKIDVWVAPGADQGGLFALHVAAAGALRGFDLNLPKTVDGSIQGAGAEDRYRFAATAGQKVTLTAKGPCTDDRSLEWGLESPDGNRVTLKARACQGLGQQTIPTAGTWAVTVYNRSKDESPHGYAFTVG